MTTQIEMEKKAAALAAIAYVPEDSIIGVGTGSTVNYFIEALALIKHKIEGAVASSEATAALLRSKFIPLIDLNSAPSVAVYIDGADECNAGLQCIKGGGGALTREKIIAAVAKKFICIADSRKKVDVLGRDFPLPIEVISMARSYVAREMVKMGGDPVYRQGVTTDNGNIIIDIENFAIMEPLRIEKEINQIAGVVSHGLFAARPADILLLGTSEGVKEIKAN